VLPAFHREAYLVCLDALHEKPGELDKTEGYRPVDDREQVRPTILARRPQVGEHGSAEPDRYQGLVGGRTFNAPGLTHVQRSPLGLRAVPPPMTVGSGFVSLGGRCDE
jgi:hypothetical protein